MGSSRPWLLLLSLDLAVFTQKGSRKRDMVYLVFCLAVQDKLLQVVSHWKNTVDVQPFKKLVVSHIPKAL